jgi:hypothetical protein
VVETGSPEAEEAPELSIEGVRVVDHDLDGPQGPDSERLGELVVRLLEHLQHVPFELPGAGGPAVPVYGDVLVEDEVRAAPMAEMAVCPVAPGKGGVEGAEEGAQEERR